MKRNEWKLESIGGAHPPEVIEAMKLLLDYSIERDGVVALFPIGVHNRAHGFAVFGSHPSPAIAAAIQGRVMQYVHEGVAKAENIARN